MTFSQRLLACVLPLLLSVFALGFAAPARAENEIQVREARLEPSDGGWSLDARFAFELNSSLEDAVNRGISLYFTTDFELTRSRWYWFDEKVVSSSQSVRLWFQPLTRQYRVSSNSGNSSNGLQLGFGSLREALALVRNVSGWRVIDKGVVTLEDDPDDARHKRLALTAFGERMRNDAQAAMTELTGVLAARIGQERFDQLLETLAADWGKPV